VREAAGEVDAGDFRAALFAEAAFRAFVALAVRVSMGVRGRLDERPAEVAGTVFGERAAPV
jgi:hypothetical protein